MFTKGVVRKKAEDTDPYLNLINIGTNATEGCGLLHVLI